MHPTLDAQLDMSTYRTEIFGEYSIQSSGAGDGSDERLDFDATERIGGGAIYGWIYPGFTINRYGPAMDTNWCVPRGPDRCEVFFDFFFENPEGDEAQRFIAESLEQCHVTQLEDVQVSESVQRGLRSGSWRSGRYAPRVEMSVHQFHCLLARDLKGTAGVSG